MKGLFFMNKRTKQDLDPYKSTPQVFQRKVTPTKHYKGCRECGDNNNGFCLYYNQWCYMCSHNCNPKDDGHIYQYKDKRGKRHIIRY